MKKIAFLASLLCATFAMAAPTITGMTQIDLSTSGETDKYVRFVLADEFSDGFDNTWDTPAPNESGIYVYYGSARYTGWASKQYTASLPLGFYTGENTSYTLKFSNFSGTAYTIYDRVADKTISVASSTNIQINGVDADPANQYTFTIDESLKNSQINDRFIINPVYVEGSWNGWASWSVAFWDNGDGSVICEVENLEANTEYEFGLHFGTQSGSWATNGYTYKSDYKSTADFEHDALAGNMKLQTEAAGTYTFKWEYATRTFSIIFPTPAPSYVTSVTTNADGLATFSYDADLEVVESGVKLYKGAVSGEYLDLDEVDYVKAAEGVIVYGAANTTYHFNAGTGTSDFSGNKLKAASTWAYPHAGYDAYVLSGSSLYLYEGDNMKPNKAFLLLPSSSSAPRRIAFRFNQPTAIDNAKAEQKAEKFIGEDGQILIKRGNEVFNLQGQIVK